MKLADITSKYSPSSTIAGMLADETGVKDIRDVKYSQNEKSIKLYFGDITLVLGKEEMRNPNVKKGLAELELSYSFTNNGAVILKWRGEKVGEVKE